ncbi:MAG TPA: DUF92 domain-containing protein [Terriglobia bacterium]|nr:DUF92 domain-containing protein [Terriglobia bacterium]
MPDLPATAAARRPLISSRKIVHISMLSFAFLLPFLTWIQAAGAAVLALLFNLFILPHIAVDLKKRAGDDVAANTWTGIILYPISVLTLILFYRNNMHIAAAAWAIMALGDGAASVAGEGLRGPLLPWNREKTWSGFCGFVIAGTVGAYALSRWVSPSLPVGRVMLICAATALVGAVVESVPIRLDDNVSVPLVSGAFMFCIYFVERSALDTNLPFLGRRILLAVAVNAVFAILALGLKMITRSGAAVGFVLGVAIYLGYGYKSFCILLGFFLLGSIATRLGYAVKAARGVAERRRGARSWREALANSLAGASFSILVITTHHEAAFLLALVAAFAEAAGDTVSSEIGQWLSGRAYLITTFKPVPAGVDGGISAGGTVAGFVASALIVALGYGLGLCGPWGLTSAAIALGAGFVGNLFDSLLGATIERRGLVTNSIVNLSGTSFAGGLALVAALYLQM